MSSDELLDLGNKYFLEMDYEKSAVYFDQLIEIEPKNPRGYTGLAKAQIGQTKYEDAVDTLQNGMEELPEDIDYMQDAVQIYGDIIDKSPKISDAYVNLAEIHVKLEDNKSAIEVLRSGLVQLPEDKHIEKSLNKLKQYDSLSYEEKEENCELKASSEFTFFKKIKYPYFTDNLKISEILNKKYSDILFDCKNSNADFKNKYSELIKRYGTAMKIPRDSQHVYSNAEVTYNKNGYISIWNPFGFSEWIYSNYNSGITYNIKDSEELVYTDLIRGTDEQIDTILSYYGKKKYSSFSLTRLKDHSPFTLNEDGLRFYYYHDNILPRSDTQDIVIPYTDIDSPIISAEKLINEINNLPSYSSTKSLQPSETIVWAVKPELPYDSIRYFPFRRIGLWREGFIGYIEAELFIIDEKTGDITEKTRATGGYGTLYAYHYDVKSDEFYYSYNYESYHEEKSTVVQESMNTIVCVSGVDKKYAIYCNGKFVSGFIYDDVIGGNSIAFVKKNNKYALADTDGKVLTDFIFDNVAYIAKRYIAVCKGEKWGFVDSAGNEVIPFIFDDALNIDADTAFVKFDGKYGILDVNETASRYNH